MIRKLVWIGGLLGLVVLPAPVLAQGAPFDPEHPRSSFDAMAEYLARDGGKWRGANPNYDGSASSPPEFGLWFERHLEGRVLQIQIVVHYADRTVLSSHGQWTWHPGRNEVSYVVTDRGGGVSEGVTTFPDASTFRTDATRVGPSGVPAPHRDDNVLVSDSVHVNETFSLDNGEWVSGGVYEWRREPVVARSLELPPRAPSAEPASALLERVAGLDLEAREEVVLAEVLGGNVPSWLRSLVRVDVDLDANDRSATLSFWVTPDYLAVGSDEDYALMPLSPQTAQRIADVTGTSLPTPQLVDAIWSAAPVKLVPSPIPPSEAMTTVPVFQAHDRTTGAMRSTHAEPLGTLVAGHKKDVVLTSRLDTLSGKVAIYGWHEPNGEPIQPLYTGHTDRWVDYSHGVRLVSRTVLIDGVRHDLIDVLGDPELADLVSADGAMRATRYSLIPAPSRRP